MFPKSIIGRVLAALWLAACVWVLFFGYEQQHIHDMPEAFVWLMIYLTFPVGLLGAAVVGIAWSTVTTQLGLPYQPFWDLVPYWVTLVALGYLQWFVVVPMLVQKVRRVISGT